MYQNQWDIFCFFLCGLRSEQGVDVFPCGRKRQLSLPFSHNIPQEGFNFETLIATKASRLIRAAQGRAIVEFGSRRAQGYDGAMLGARAAYIAGCAGTACTIVIDTDEWAHHS